MTTRMGRNGPINVGCPAVLVYDVSDGIRPHALAEAIEEQMSIAIRAQPVLMYGLMTLRFEWLRQPTVSRSDSSAS
jgi:hypothetical protein